MFSRRPSARDAVPLVVAGVVVLAVPLGVGPASLATGVKTVPAEAKLVDTEAWIMGASGMPIPTESYLAGLEQFVDPTTPFFVGQPQFPVDATNSLYTPEGLYPTTGVQSLELDPSLAQGVSILNSTIESQIADGNSLVVVGASQSATIAALEMDNLLAQPTADQPAANQLSFVLVDSPSAPDGGLLERFGDPSLPPLTLPSLGITFSGATPSDTPWDTAIYSQEYDGFSDFPRYPINLLSDINAALGTIYVHGTALSFDAQQMATAVELPVSADYTGDTQYFMFPTADLPLLDPVREIPVIGNPIADLLQPDLQVLVNLGYGSITEGWDQGPANVATPMGLLPPASVLEQVPEALVKGLQQGVQAFTQDLGSLSTQSISEASTSGVDATTASLPSLTDIVNAISGAASSAYSALLPTADIANALLTTLPAYDVSLFGQELASGNLLDAIGLPIAADFGITPVLGVFELGVIDNAVTAIVSDLQGLI